MPRSQLYGNVARYLATPPTLTDGDYTPLMVDVNGALKISGGPSNGDVAGPASSTDNAITRFDGTTGKTIQNSSATISDAGLLTATSVTTGALIVDSLRVNQAPTAGVLVQSHSIQVNINGTLYYMLLTPV